MKTYVPRAPGDDRAWWLVDAADRPLGRLAVQIANVLRGKHKPVYTPHVDMGDAVVVINAEKVKLTGRKETQKIYMRYSGYRAGLKRIPANEMRERHPDRMIRQAVRGMLPKNRLAADMFSRLKVYAGEDHPHAAQRPAVLDKA